MGGEDGRPSQAFFCAHSGPEGPPTGHAGIGSPGRGTDSLLKTFGAASTLPKGTGSLGQLTRFAARLRRHSVDPRRRLNERGIQERPAELNSNKAGGRAPQGLADFVNSVISGGL